MQSDENYFFGILTIMITIEFFDFLKKIGGPEKIFGHF